MTDLTRLGGEQLRKEARRADAALADEIVRIRANDERFRAGLSRAKGWRMPANTVKVDRTTMWGNPYSWAEWYADAPRDVLWFAHERKQWAREQAVESFAADVRSGAISLPMADLRGKNLACWCPPGPRYTCHADVLLELANASEADGPPQARATPNKKGAE